MTTTESGAIHLRGPGDMIAAVPYLLGFHPKESIVLCAHSGPSAAKITVCLRADIPPPGSHWSLAEQLMCPILRANATSVTVLMICEGAVKPPQPLPHKEVVEAVSTVLRSVGVAVNHALWTTAIEEGATWWCYDSLECNGQVPNPGDSELAAAAAMTGLVTYDSKDEMRATLEPRDRRPLGVRAERIGMAVRQGPSEERARKIVEDAIADAREGPVKLDEDRIVDLAVALTHYRVRDLCLDEEVTRLGHPIERLWADLTREMPIPHRAQPAALLAVMAFLRGDGALAGVALDVAFDADPDHSISHLLRYAMDVGLPPGDIAEAIARGGRESRSQCS